MSDKFTTTFTESIPLVEGFIKRGILDVLPSGSHDEHGNFSYEGVIVCSDGTQLKYTPEDRRADLDSVYAASGGDAVSREYVAGIPFIQSLEVEEHYDLDQLPSPLQSRCDVTSHER